jgi:hypothetical protein
MLVGTQPFSSFKAIMERRIGEENWRGELERTSI